MMTLTEKKLHKAILGRDRSFLAEDIAAVSDRIREQLTDARVLVIGAAGSIGSSFVRELCQFQPSGLHLLDISENNLVEVVRDLRSGSYSLPEDFQTYAIDYGGPEMGVLLRENQYEYVLNFSALKHVRSERDAFTLMRLLEVNVLANARLLDHLAQMPTLRGAFSVSSDKSVRPANLMGASKAFMERAFLARADEMPFGSARFANVAFSDGSLLHGFRHRIAKQQPLSAPSDVRRYFITHQEAGQLCILGCFTGGSREIYFPKFDPDRDMLTFAEIARVYLKELGYVPVECESAEAARTFMEARPSDSNEWACYFSASDTAGEKLYEEFSDPAESVDLERFINVGVVTQPLFHGRESINSAIATLQHLREQGDWAKEQLIDCVRQAVPELEHVLVDKNLDQKM